MKPSTLSPESGTLKIKEPYNPETPRSLKCEHTVKCILGIDIYAYVYMWVVYVYANTNIYACAYLCIYIEICANHPLQLPTRSPLSNYLSLQQCREITAARTENLCENRLLQSKLLKNFRQQC